MFSFLLSRDTALCLDCHRLTKPAAVHLLSSGLFPSFRLGNLLGRMEWNVLSRNHVQPPVKALK